MNFRLKNRKLRAFDQVHMHSQKQIVRNVSESKKLIPLKHRITILVKRDKLEQLDHLDLEEHLEVVVVVSKKAEAPNLISRKSKNKIFKKRSRKHLPDCQIREGNPKRLKIVEQSVMTVRIVVDSAFGCAGQRCLAASVAITVGEARNVFTEMMADVAANRVVGYGLESGVQMGPVISPESKTRIESLIGKGAQEGADLLPVAGAAVEPHGAPPALVGRGLVHLLDPEVGILDGAVHAVVEDDRALAEPAGLDVGLRAEVFAVEVLAALERAAERDGEDAPLGAAELLGLHVIHGASPASRRG